MDRAASDSEVANDGGSVRLKHEKGHTGERSHPAPSDQTPDAFFPLLQTTYWEEGTDQPVATTTSPSQLRVQGLINPRTQQTKFLQQPSAANGQRHDVTDHHAMLGAATISSPVRNASKKSVVDDPLLFPSPQTLRALEENSRMVWKTYQVQAAKEVLARHVFNLVHVFLHESR